MLQPGPPGQGDGVELAGGVPQVRGLQHVAAAAVDQEAALVQTHVGAACLEVQRHCRPPEGAPWGHGPDMNNGEREWQSSAPRP